MAVLLQQFRQSIQRRSLGLAGLLLACGVRPAAAQNYPDRVIKIINPFPGGPTDIFARLVAAKLQARLGQPVIVDGRPGAGGTIAVAQAARAAPDGYTLLVTSSSTQIVQPVMRQSMPYNADKDFISLFTPGPVPTVIVAGPSSKINTFQQLIDHARASPGALSYGSSGQGTALHLAGEVFAHEAQVKLLHVPYKTAALATTDLLGGQVDLMFDSLSNSAPNIKAGKLVPLAIMGQQRAPSLPDVKTTAELGHPRIRLGNALGVYAPAGTPASIVERVVASLKGGLQDADFTKFMEASGTTPLPLFGREFDESNRSQRQELATLVKSANIPSVD